MSKRKFIDDEVEVDGSEFDSEEDEKFSELLYKETEGRGEKVRKVYISDIGGWGFTGSGTIDDPYEFLCAEDYNEFFDRVHFLFDDSSSEDADDEDESSD